MLSAGRFTRGGGAGAGITDQAADDKILAEMADGATLVLQALHRTWPPLVDFGPGSSASSATRYRSTPTSRRRRTRVSPPHYDVHDVFVLQVAGRKRWTIHEPVVEARCADQPWETARAEVAARAAEQPLIDTVLEPGDALYLPRGTIHAAQALGEMSIHLTVGVHPVTRYHLVRNSARARPGRPRRCGRRCRWASTWSTRRCSPPSCQRRCRSRRPARVGRWLGRGGGRRSCVGDDVTSQTRPEPIGPLAQLRAVERWVPRPGTFAARGLRFRITRRGDELHLRLLDRTIELASHAERRQGGADRRAPDAGVVAGLDADEQLALVRRLLREGVLVPPDAWRRSGRMPPRESSASARVARSLCPTRPAARRPDARHRVPGQPAAARRATRTVGPSRLASLALRPRRRGGARRARRGTRIRVLAIRRPGRTPRDVVRRWALIDCRGDRETVRWGSYESDAELLDLPLDGSAGEPDPAACLPRLHAQQARHLLRVARPPCRRGAARGPAGSGVGVQPRRRRPLRRERAGAARRACCTGGCCRSPPLSSSPPRRPARSSVRCCGAGSGCRRRRRPRSRSLTSTSPSAGGRNTARARAPGTEWRRRSCGYRAARPHRRHGLGRAPRRRSPHLRPARAGPISWLSAGQRCAGG